LVVDEVILRTEVGNLQGAGGHQTRTVIGVPDLMVLLNEQDGEASGSDPPGGGGSAGPSSNDYHIVSFVFWCAIHGMLSVLSGPRASRAAGVGSLFGGARSGGRRLPGIIGYHDSLSKRSGTETLEASTVELEAMYRRGGHINWLMEGPEDASQSPA
jgi:hypothetical protein